MLQNGTKRVVSLCVGVFLIVGTSLSAAEQSVRPNIIVILADDMGFSDIGCYGSEIRTPNLDRLASEGMRFTQFYNASKCEPTRASLLSGLYWEEAQRGIRRGITIAEALHSVGYSTLATGKWHLDGNPVDRGFDHWFGFLNGASNYFLGNKFFRLDHETFQVPAKGFYTTDAFTDYAIRFVETARKTTPEKPFFLYLAYNAPHAPLQAPPEEIARYRGKYAKGWDELRRGALRKTDSARSNQKGVGPFAAPRKYSSLVQSGFRPPRTRGPANGCLRCDGRSNGSEHRASAGQAA